MFVSFGGVIRDRQKQLFTIFLYQTNNSTVFPVYCFCSMLQLSVSRSAKPQHANTRYVS